MNKIASRGVVASLLYVLLPTTLIGLTVLAIWRGSAHTINSHVLTYYVINYSDGLIRRALVGELFSWFVSQRDLQAVSAALISMYVPLLIVLLVGVGSWVAAIEWRRRDLLVSSMFAVVLASQFLSTLAYDVGFLDIFDFLLITIAAASLARRQYAGAIVAGCIGPFIHEAFVFYWLALVPLVLWDRPSKLRVAVLMVPLFSTLIVYFGASQDAAVAQIDASVLPDGDKDGALKFPLGQTLTSNVDMMLIKFRNYLVNVFAAGAFFTFPAAVIVILYGTARRSWIDVMVLAAAALAPLLILMFAWDLSRFLTSAIFFAMIATLYMETVRPTDGVPWPRPLIGWLCAAFLVQVPFTYAYFEVAGVPDVGPASLRDGPIGRLTRTGVSLYSRAIGPMTTDRQGADALPAGNVWYVEEDIWQGAWVRRPGSNVFDATMTLPVGIVVTYTASVERDGNTIIARRNMGARRMDYVGILRGNAIAGTYPGGYWFAKIK